MNTSIPWKRITSTLRQGLLVLASSILLSQAAHANFVNGDFESGNLSGWTAEKAFNYSGISPFPPTSTADLLLTSTTGTVSGVTTVLTPGAVATDPNTNGGLSYPRFGNSVARVNFGGTNYSVNTLRQTALMTAADVDPVDNKLHIRFAIAPVLQNPSHSDHQQPYFFIQVRNLTKGTTLYTTFNFSNQPGIPWKTGASADILYTDWQAADIAPGAGMLDVGDQVELTVIGAGCSQGGHWGYLYLDAVGTFMQGLSIATQGATTVYPGNTITYTYTYQNNSGISSTNTIVKAAMPITGNNLSTTYVSHSVPAGVTCTQVPAVGSAGTLECNFGTLADHQTGTFQLTVTVPPGASTVSPTDVVNNGNYTIQADSVSAFIGSLWQTKVLPVGAATTDLSVSITDGISALAYGATTTYTVTVQNNGPSNVVGAKLSEITKSNVTLGNWTCQAADSKATCGVSSGSGTLADTVNLQVGGKLTYTVNATASSAAGVTQAILGVHIASPSNVTDSNLSNNQSTDVNSVGAMLQLTANKTGTGNGLVSSSPIGIQCDTACSTGTMQALDRSTVTLTAAPNAQSTFTGWSGACTGTGPCTVTFNGSNLTVTANFVLNMYTLTANKAGIGNGTVTSTPAGIQCDTSCNTATSMQVGDGNTVTLIATPDAQSVFTGWSGACTGTGSCTVTINSANASVTANFVPVAATTYQLTASKTGAGNGTVSSTPAGIQCDTSCNAATGMPTVNGDSITLTATPDAQSTFTGWSGACSGTGPCAVTVNGADLAVIANFIPKQIVIGGNPQPIPTLGQWALWLLSMLIAAIAWRRYRYNA